MTHRRIKVVQNVSIVVVYDVTRVDNYDSVSSQCYVHERGYRVVSEDLNLNGDPTDRDLCHGMTNLYDKVRVFTNTLDLGDTYHPRNPSRTDGVRGQGVVLLSCNLFLSHPVGRGEDKRVNQSVGPWVDRCRTDDVVFPDRCKDINLYEDDGGCKDQIWVDGS